MICHLQVIIVSFSIQYLSNINTIFTSTTKEKETYTLEHRIYIKNIFQDIIRRSDQSFIFALFPPSGGPTRDKNYNPTYGYEPYWPAGDWVYTDTPNKTTVGVLDEICGVSCQPMLKYYGKICGRDRNYNHKTFENYCDLYNEDCSLRAGWLIAYRGECQEELKTYPTESALLATRASSYIAAFDYEKLATDILQHPFLNKYSTKT